MGHYHTFSRAFLGATGLFPHFNLELGINKVVLDGVCKPDSHGVGFIILYIRAVADVIRKRCGDKRFIRGSASCHKEFYFLWRDLFNVFSAIIHCNKVEGADNTKQ